MKYTVVSRHSEDLGLGKLLAPGEEFDDKDVPEHLTDRVKEMVKEGTLIKSSEKEKKSGGD